MASINSYKITDIYWNPIDFNIIGEQFKLKKMPINFDNGMSFNLFDCFENVQDLKFNNKSGMFLTDLKNNSTIIEDNNSPSYVSNLSLIESPIASNDKKIFNIVNNKLILSSFYKFSIKDKLIFSFYNGKIFIKNSDNYLLTDKGLGDNGLIFTPQINPPDNSQLFDYILGDGYISIFRNESNYSVIVALVNNTIQLQNFNTNSSTIPSNCIFFLPSFSSNSKNNTSVKDSFLVTYETNPLLSRKDLKVKTKTQNYFQNYLGIFPSEIFTIENNEAIYDLYFHPLKNYQTPEYLYNNNNLNRTYKKIYTGTNQRNGSDSICLSYTSNSIKVEFKSNASTKFYFNPIGNIQNLSDVGFIEDGATAGETPYISDRIYQRLKTNAPYLTSINIIHPETDNNYWLCSWLYKDSNGDKKWLDRYYNPAYYSVDQALSATKMVYHSKLDSNLSYCYDIPSTTKIMPNVLYEYYHVGKQDSKNFLKYFDYNYKTNKPSKILTITNWLSSPLQDDSTFKNNGLVYNNDDANFKGNYWVLDGNNYAIFPAKDILLENKNLTTSLWLNVQEWSNIQGNQIFGNYYDSGFGLLNESDIFSPIITLINNDTAQIQNLNYRFGKISKADIPNNPSSHTFDFIQRLPNYDYWVFDSENLRAIKYNVDDRVQIDKNIGYGITTISQIETDSYENLYIYDNNSKKYIKLNSNGDLLGTYNVTSNTNRIEIDLNDNVLQVYGNTSTIDNNNVLWEIIGSNLYKNKKMYATVGKSKQIICDRKNNLWITSENDLYTKINSDGTFAFTYQFSKNPISDTNCSSAPPIVTHTKKAIEEDLPFISTTDYKYVLTNDYLQILVTEETTKTIYPPSSPSSRRRSINFINSPINTDPCNKQYAQEDLLIMIDENDREAYLINQNGVPVSKLNFSGLSNINTNKFFAYGDFTGYQHTRKFKSIKKNLSWNFKIADSLGNQPQLLSLKYSVSSLPPGWHHFAFTFDSDSGLAKYYIDSVEVDSINFEPYIYELHYDYRTSLLLGATTVKNSILNNLLNSDKGYKFVGSIADLRMYNIYLNQGDIEQIYNASDFSPQSTDLIWNADIGERDYIEEIKHWFQFKMPANKSKYYNINIHNFKADDNVKKNIEQAMKNVINKISPSYTSLYKINWS